eukprot:4508384-Pleurochrysis_carterae.AAC.1
MRSAATHALPACSKRDAASPAEPVPLSACSSPPAAAAAARAACTASTSAPPPAAARMERATLPAS